MTEEQAFLDAIRDAPDDDTPRLVFADWLEEHGQPERAEFIRVQCELARIRADAAVAASSGTGEGPHRNMPSAEIRERCNELVAREWESWDASVLRWVPPWMLPQDEDVAYEQARHGTSWDFRRGFLSTVICSWADWQAHGDAILADPWVPGLERVELTTWPTIQYFRLAHDNLRYYFAIEGREEKNVVLDLNLFTHVPTAAEIETEVLGRIVPRLLEKLWPKKVRSWKMPPLRTTTADRFNDYVREAEDQILANMGIPPEMVRGSRGGQTTASITPEAVREAMRHLPLRGPVFMPRDTGTLRPSIPPR